MIPHNPPARPASWWQRRVVALIARQLTQGTTPAHLALALALGGVIAVNPFLGTTTLGCAAVGVLFGLNQPVLQLVNLLGAPVQLVLIVPWVRAGEWLYGASAMPVNPAMIIHEFSAGPGLFLRRFGLTGLHAATAWAIAAPLLGGALFLVLHPLLRGLGRRLPTRTADAPSGVEPARTPLDRLGALNLSKRQGPAQQSE
jgi:uncharacterized protein (DUF2062 family)